MEKKFDWYGAFFHLLITSLFVSFKDVLTQTTENDLGNGFVYLTNRTSVLRYSTFQNGSLNNNELVILHSNKVGHIRSLELDPNNRAVYWGDFKENAIYKSSLDGNEVENLFHYGIGYPQGLAVDWSSNILYWTDSLMKMVELSTIYGSHRKVLFKLKSRDEPRGIVADPHNGYLFWTDWGDNPKIERCTLAGDDRKTIISTDVVWPNDLALDIYKKRIYWIDAFKDTIEVSDFNGLNRRLFIQLSYQNHVIHPFSFTVPQNTSRAYVTDWYSDAVFFLENIYSNVSARLLLDNSRGQKNVGQIRHLAYWYPMVSSPCQTFQHTCSHLCLKNGINKAKCACPNGFVLVNATTCKPAIKDIEIYFADKELGEIFHLTKYKNQYGFTTKTLLSKSKMKKSPVAVDFHKKDELIYWTDESLKMILRSKLDGSQLSQITNGLLSVYKAIAIDQLNDVIFYFDDIRRALMMTSLDAKHTVTIKSNDMFHITDIVLYEEKGLIYFSDYKDKLIGRIKTDGTALQFMSETEHVVSLALDKTEDRLYWANDYDYSIKSSTLTFQDIQILVKESIYMFDRFWMLENYGTVVKPFSISVYGDKIYWSDTHKKAIYATNKHFGGEIEYITSGLKKPNDLHVFRSSQNDIKGSTTSSVYMFSFANTSEKMSNSDKQNNNDARTLCWESSTECLPVAVEDPPPCPPGYKEKRMGTKCSNCSETRGKKFVCPCNSWENCAQRTFNKINGCISKEKTFIKFKVRECVKEDKIGYCPFNSLTKCRLGEKSCISDNDCPGERKCCNTLCGAKCLQPDREIVNPCHIKNGGCSHVCMTSQNEHFCACPDHMQLKNDRKTCEIIENICDMKSDHGSCSQSVTKHFYDKSTGICAPFLYGGCKGNPNRFDSEKLCAEKCQGSCYGNSYCGEHGICSESSSGDISCTCKESHWIGEQCQIDIRLHVVRAVFTKVQKNISEIDLSQMARSMASFYSKFCSKEICSYSSSANPVKRVRRDTENEFNFFENDVFFTDWTSKDNEISIRYVLTESTNGQHKKNSYLGQVDILRGMNTFGEQLGQEFGLKFKSVDIIYEKVDKKPRKMKSVKILLVAFFLIISLLGVAAVVYYCYLLRKSKKRESPTTNDGVRWAFENRLYDDMNTVTLPIDNSLVINESFVNPIFERKTKNNEDGVPSEERDIAQHKNQSATVETTETVNIPADTDENKNSAGTLKETSIDISKKEWAEFEDDTIDYASLKKEVALNQNATSSSNDIDGFVYVDKTANTSINTSISSTERNVDTTENESKNKKFKPDSSISEV